MGRVTQGAEEHKDAYVRLKARLQLANATPRCRWVRQDGTSCESPQMKKHIYCFAHRQMMEARALALSLPAPEDANAIQIGIMRIQKALIEGTVSTKTAGLLLYSMQLALQNVGQTTFGQAKTQELVRATVDEETAFSENEKPTTETRRHGGESGEEKNLPLMNADGRGYGQNQNPFTTEDAENTEEGKSQNQNLFTAKDAEGAKEGKQDQYQHQRRFTTEDTEGTEASQGLPLMNTDDTDQGARSGDQVIARDRVIGKNGGMERPKPVEWKPTPDMYRTDTPEGREAYEACFRMKIEPRLDGQRRAVQSVIPPQPAQGRRGSVMGPDDNAEVHANLG
jgi:hypothetical protein